MADLDTDEAPRAGNIAMVVAAAAGVLLVVAIIFLLNSPVADREAQVSGSNPAVATLECGRPLMHDEDALRARHWSARVAETGSDRVGAADVALCEDLVDQHRDRAWVAGGLGVLLGVAAAALAAVSRRG